MKMRRKPRRRYMRPKRADKVSYAKRADNAPGCPRCGSPLKVVKDKWPRYLMCDGSACVPGSEFELGVDYSYLCGYMIKKI